MKNTILFMLFCLFVNYSQAQTQCTDLFHDQHQNAARNFLSQIFKRKPFKTVQLSELDQSLLSEKVESFFASARLAPNNLFVLNTQIQIHKKTNFIVRVQLKEMTFNFSALEFFSDPDMMTYVLALTSNNDIQTSIAVVPVDQQLLTLLPTIQQSTPTALATLKSVYKPNLRAILDSNPFLE